MTKIIPLKKLVKPDYTNLKVFRAISLFLTLSTAIEIIMAEKISYLVEKHGLLPLNHYEALKQKCTIDALFTV